MNINMDEIELMKKKAEFKLLDSFGHFEMIQYLDNRKPIFIIHEIKKNIDVFINITRYGNYILAFRTEDVNKNIIRDYYDQFFSFVVYDRLDG